MSRGRGPLLRWFISSSTFGVPQAAGPIAFSLVALSLTGQTSGGAAMMLAMTLAQVGGAIPIARLGRSLPMAAFLRVLVVIRTLALASIALLAACRHPGGEPGFKYSGWTMPYWSDEIGQFIGESADVIFNISL